MKIRRERSITSISGVASALTGSERKEKPELTASVFVGVVVVADSFKNEKDEIGSEE